MTRRGKIARLPQTIREQINQRLQNGEEAQKIVAWLNTLSEVTALMAAEFDGQPVNDVNLTNWKLGGYRDWEAQQQSLAATRQFASDAAQLTQDGGAQLTDQLALCLTARLAVALQRLASADDDPDAHLEKLRQLRKELVALRRGDHNAHWLRIEQGKLDLLIKEYDHKVAARTQDPNSRLLRADGGFTQETIEKIKKDLALM